MNGFVAAAAFIVAAYRYDYRTGNTGKGHVAESLSGGRENVNQFI